MSSPQTGAWELISDAQEGFAVFTQSHFNIYVVGKPGTGFAGSETAEEQSEAASRTMRGSGGTYTVSGSAAVLHYLVTRVPNYVGRDLKIEFEIDGDALTIQGTQPDGTRMESSTWRRLEDPGT